MTIPIIITEKDLLPVESYMSNTIRPESATPIFRCGALTAYENITSADSLHEQAIRLLSLEKALRDHEAEKTKKVHEDWLVEKILPLALVMYNKQQGSTISEETWKEFYFAKDPSTLRWVATAETVYKYLNPKDAGK